MSVPKIILKTQLEKGATTWVALVMLLYKLKVAKVEPEHFTDHDVRKFVARTLYGKMGR